MTELTSTPKRIQLAQWSIPLLAVLFFARYADSTSSSNFLPILIAGTPLLLWALFARVELVYFSLILLVPLSVPKNAGGGFILGFPSEALLGILAAYLLVSTALNPFFKRQMLFHPLIILLIMEVAWMLLCSLFSADPMVSLKRVFIRALFILVFLAFATHLADKKPGREYWLYLLYAFGLIIPVINGFIFHAEFEFSRPSAYKMPMPFFTDHTVYGACLAFLLPMLLILVFSKRTFGLRGIHHFFLVLLTSLLVIAEVLSFSRAAWVSLVVAGAFGILLLMKVKLRTIILSLCLLGGITYAYSDEIYHEISKNDAISTRGDFKEHLISVTNVQSDASNTERINRWLCAWRMAVDKPITGYGPGMYQFEYGKFQERGHMTRISTFSGNKGHAHSEYFTPLSETGFPGFILFIVIVFSVIGYGMRVIYREKDKRNKLLLYGTVLGLITFYVHGIFNAFLDTDKMAVLVFGSIAIIAAADLRQRALPVRA